MAGLCSQHGLFLLIDRARACSALTFVTYAGIAIKFKTELGDVPAFTYAVTSFSSGGGISFGIL